MCAGTRLGLRTTRRGGDGARAAGAINNKKIYLIMVASRCRGIGPPSSGIVLGILFLLAAELGRHLLVSASWE